MQIPALEEAVGGKSYLFLVMLCIQGFLISGCEMFSVHAVINVVLDTTQFNVINIIGMRSYSHMWALFKISDILFWPNFAHVSIVTSESFLGGLSRIRHCANLIHFFTYRGLMWGHIARY